jgi:hypothetical protein
MSQWKKITLAAAVFLAGWWIWSYIHSPPYEVKLNIPEGSMVGVYMQSTLNDGSKKTRLPDNVKCIRLDNRTYGGQWVKTRAMYKLYCEGREGFVLIYQVTLP